MGIAFVAIADALAEVDEAPKGGRGGTQAPSPEQTDPPASPLWSKAESKCKPGAT